MGLRFLRRKASEKRWKTASQVKGITFSKDKYSGLVRIGGTSKGDVYVGRLRFSDGSVHRVAIKKFKEPILDVARAQVYQKVINDLVKAGVRLPKMAMTKLPSGEWVQVSQLFGSTRKGSKIVDKSFYIETREARKEAVVELTKIANAGYYPTRDSFERFKDISKGIIPFDLDNQVSLGKSSPAKLAEHLAWQIGNNLSTTPQEVRELMAIAIKSADFKLKRQLKKRLKNYKK